jgi:uncharacterized protein YbjT (DUF2867 family)/uncharacterized protein YndB with AHSA1/START domain
MARNVGKLTCRPWADHPNVEIVSGDALDKDSLVRAVQGCGAVYYLVHSMSGADKDFVSKDREAAKNMVAAAQQAEVQHIIYLGGLGEEETTLSKHLRSRHEVARILQTGPVPVTHLRAGMILGSGSASFEILRYLVDRLPVMITPRWVHTPCQPIAIRTVLHYLKGCLEQGETKGETLDIGGPEVVTYREIMDTYAEEARLRKRLVLPVPVLTPRLSSYWIHLVTPVHASIARPLAEGLSTPVLCKDDRILKMIPAERLTCREAIRLALERVEQQRVETSWTDAGSVVPPEWIQEGDAPYAGGTILACAHRIRLRADPEEVWRPISRIGGENGWYYGDFLWTLRAWMDMLAGGSGIRRGRRHPENLYRGDALDFWRVLEVNPPKRLVLLAEMKMPGEATLEFRVTRRARGETELQQISTFLPRGLYGIGYWWAFYPFHLWLFRGMLRSIAERVGKPVVDGPASFNPSAGLDASRQESG